MTSAATQAAVRRGFLFPAAVALASWLVPGLGHLILRLWGRAVVFFLCVAALALSGILLRGHIFAFHPEDAFEMLGFLADIGAGGFYFLSRLYLNGGPDVSVAAGDYGTRFFATAGVLNLLCALDAYDTASGKKD